MCPAEGGPIPSSSGVPPTVALEFANEIGAIEDAVEQLVRRCAPVCADTRRLYFNFRIGLTEALANAVLYGNGQDPAKKVRVELHFEDAGIRVRVTDEGVGFDPAAVPDPTLPENVSKTVGRGIFLMRELMDEVHFNASGNSVTLLLRLAEENDPGDAIRRCR